MIAALKKKFIVTAMTAVTVLLLVLLGVLNLANAFLVERQSARTMERVVSMQYHTPPRPPKDGFRLFPDPFAGNIEDIREHYFIAVYARNGMVRSINMEHISSLTQTQALLLCEAADADTGRVGQFCYMFYLRPNGEKVGVFLDVSLQRGSILTVLALSVVVGTLCWAAMLLLVTLLSRRAIAPIAENIERQKRFVTDAGHEIKTPLAIILANTEAMELHCGATKWSRNIRAQTERLDGLTKRLLMLSRADENVRYCAQPLSFSDLTKNSVEEFRAVASLKKITLYTEIAPDVTVCGDREQLICLLSLLLDNAVKYTAEAGEITVTLSAVGHFAVLTEENPCAQAPDAARLFDRFYRADAARGQKSGGFGIGLSAARAIVHAHNGEIKANQEKDGWIRFTVKLPLRQKR